MIKFSQYLNEKADTALKKKADKSGVSLSILRKVYDRGVAAWRTGHRPGTTPQQWGMARVNSYITKGKGTYHGADKDLREAYFDKGAEVTSLPNNAKAMKSIKLNRKADGDEITFHDDGKNTYMTIRGASQKSKPYKFNRKLKASDYDKATKEFLKFM